MAPQAPRAVLRCSVVIVGGGPHALACLAALVGGDGKSPVRGTVAVIDPGSHFLDAWYGRFRALEIDRLRSPAYVHPSAFEPTALVEFAIREGRTAELEAAPVAVQWMPTTDHRPEHADSSGASLLKALPSSALFRDFCASLEAELPHKWLRGTATRVARAGGGGGGGGSSFRVQYSAAGEPHELREVEAAALILATGPVGAWSIPPPFAPLLSAASSACGRVLHSEQLLTQGRGTLREEVARRSGGDGGPASVLVIGGGISAAQAALTASRAGHRVVLRSRRPLQSRPFDIAVGWLDVRHADRLRFEYLCLPPTRRLQAIRDATAGGSVPAPYLEELQRLAASPGSSLRIEVDEAVDRSVCTSTADSVQVNGEDFDLVVLCTGVAPEPLTSSALFRSVEELLGAPTVGGLPRVDSSLRWSRGEDVFVLGANAGLELGPGGGNLVGGMRGARVVSNELHVLMREGVCAPPRSGWPDRTAFANKYAALLDGREPEVADDKYSFVLGRRLRLLARSD
uniref:Uncharacterized protein n=1 Tax=Emiliania huxleyi TaxID=2903 RepID=A0A6V2N7U4_EMIHU|mmetsp:Transcript_27769/g.83007  ORF Transcript_27769/g.83007 Transcript_27769/m.83007 type:complete len:515 (+) Transcript_27769:99-1643(+)